MRNQKETDTFQGEIYTYTQIKSVQPLNEVCEILTVMTPNESCLSVSLPSHNFLSQ